MALAADRKLDHRTYLPVEYGYPVQLGARVYRGSIVALCSDRTLIPAGVVGTPPAVVLVGIADHQMSNVPNTGIASSLNSGAAVRCRRGSFQLPFDVAPPVSAIGAPVYALDDQTVSLSNASGAHLQLGALEGFDERGNPWVRV